MAAKDETAEPAGAALEPGIHTDFRRTMSYGAYLGLDRLLSAQTPLSDSHDELLFIVLHQASELWFKVMLHEVAAATARLRDGEAAPAVKMLARICRILGQLVQSWDVLSTLTPADYLAFRDRLGRASGLQSHQYRLLERAYPSEPGLTTCWVCGCRRRNVRLMFCHAQPLEVRPPDVPRRLRGALSR